MAEGMEKGVKGFQKGHAPLAGCGRPLGSKSANKQLMEYFRNACVDLFPEFLMTLRSVREEDPKTYLDVYMKMTERVIPKMMAIAFDGGKNATTAQEHLRELSSWNKSINNESDEKD